MADTLAAPAAATSDAGSSGSYVESLSGTADPGSVDGLLSGDASLDEGGQIEDGSAQADAPVIDAAFEARAKEAGFEDLQNLTPAQRLALQKVLGGDPAAAKAAPVLGTADPSEELTDLEKEVAAAVQPEKVAAPAEVAKPDAAPEAPKQGYGDIGDKWKSPKDAYLELGEAYQASDMDKVHEIEGAMFARRFNEMAMPYVRQQIDAGVKAALAKMGVTDVIPEVQKDLQERRSEANIDVAKKQVGKLPGNESFAKLFEAVEPGKTLMFKGQQYPDTPYNRIMAANPELQNIRVQHSDPNKAEQLTYVAIYKAAARLHRQAEQQKAAIQPEQAKGLVEAGAQIKSRSEQDRVRQTLNAGVGASGAGSGLGKKGVNGSYVAEINRPAAELSLSDLFSR